MIGNILSHRETSNKNTELQYYLIKELATTAASLPGATREAHTAPTTKSGMTSDSDNVGDKIKHQLGSDKCLMRTMDELDSALRRQQSYLKKQQLPPASTTSSTKPMEKSVIIHRDENGFGLRIKGQSPVLVEHVHENGAAWRAGVRRWDRISKVNGSPVSTLGHKQVVLMFKSCSRFVSLSLVSSGSASTSQSVDSASLQQLDQDREALSSQLQLINSMVHNPSRRSTLGPASATVQTAFDWHDADACRFSFGYSRPVLEQHTDQLVVPAGNQQQAAARRSESVAVRPSYLSHMELLGTGGHQLGAKQHSSGTSTNELASSASCCLNCRAPFAGTCCTRCTLKLAPDVLQCAQLITRGYGSMKDPLRSQQVDLSATSSQQTLAPNGAQKVMRNFHKLTQSASMVSLARVREQSSKKSSGQVSRQSAVSGPTPLTSSIQLVHQQNHQKKPINKRLEIIREFIDTERTHTERLRCLDELFYRPLKAAEYMTGEQLRAVFSCHRTLYKIHRQIYRTLLSANYSLYAEPLVGSALLEIFEGDLKRRLERAACTFCAAQSTNVELLNKLTRRDTKVGEFLAQVTSQQMIGRLGIKDLLASCFQRLTKYPLLLENLLKATPQIALPSPTATAPNPSTNARRKRQRNSRSATINSFPIQPDSNSAGDEETCDDRTFRVGGDSESGGDNDDQHEQTDSYSAHQDTGEQAFQEEGQDDQNDEGEEERNSRRMLAISLHEEREFIQRALQQSRQILVRVNEAIKEAISHNKLKEIWKRTDKYPGVPLIDISKQQVVHEGLLTLRLSKRSFDVYVLLLNDYIIILTREGQDKYRLKFFTPEGKSSSSLSSSGSQSAVYSPVFVIDEHLTTRDAATDENGFYLLCKRKDDSRIYEFASRSPAERLNWRDKIQWTIERQMNKADRRLSCVSTVTKSSSEISARQEGDECDTKASGPAQNNAPHSSDLIAGRGNHSATDGQLDKSNTIKPDSNQPDQAQRSSFSGDQPTKIEGTISYVEDDGIVLPSRMESSRPLVERAVQVNIFESILTANEQQQISTLS